MTLKTYFCPICGDELVSVNQLHPCAVEDKLHELRDQFCGRTEIAQPLTNKEIDMVWGVIGRYTIKLSVHGPKHAEWKAIYAKLDALRIKND
jgi:hypothetical protein